MKALLQRARTDRRTAILLVLLALAAVLTLVFGARLAGRFLYRPSREPVKEWMNVPYIARAHGIPPQEIGAAIGIAPPQPGQRPDTRPLSAIAKERNVSSDELIKLIEAKLAQGPPRPGRGQNKAPQAVQTATPAP